MSDDLRYDVRVVRFRMQRKEFTEDHYAKYLDGLPDEADEGEPTTTEFVATWAQREQAAANGDASEAE